MPTRFWFPASEAAAVSPAFTAGWDNTGQAVRRRLAHVKGTSALTGGTIIQWSGSGQTDALDRQYVSDEMAAGVVFQSGVTTCKCYLMARQFAGSDEVEQRPLSIRVFSSDGSTVRATVWAKNLYASINELTTTYTNRSWANGDTATGSYTTVDGDRLVVEIGYEEDAFSGTSDAQALWGELGTDIPENESNTTQNPGWIEFSNTITMAADVAGQPTMRRWGGVPGMPPGGIKIGRSWCRGKSIKGKQLWLPETRVLFPEKMLLTG